MSEGNVAADQLRLFIERAERLIEEKKGIADDIKDVFAEAKSNGYDPKIMREIVKLRAMETHVRQEREALLETYQIALGMAHGTTPLEDAISRMKDSGIVSVSVNGGEEIKLDELAEA